LQRFGCEFGPTIAFRAWTIRCASQPSAMTRRDKSPSGLGPGSPARRRRAALRREQDLIAELAIERGKTALRQTEQQLEFALQAGRMGSWELDLAGRRFKTSEYCRVVFGLGPDDPFDTVDDLMALVHPDDRQKRQDAISHAIAGHTEMEVEYRTRRPDGSIGWVLARGRAVYEDGQAVRMAGISLDITARKLAEERQVLLINELNHRVKNTLASVQSLAMQTYRGAEANAGADEAFIERLYALARVHDLLSETAWEGASLADVVGQTLAPYVEEAGRFTIAGPVVRLIPNAAVSLNMAFHELATNAMKYGALSTPAGRVDIAWRAEGEDVAIDWRESGGPRVAEPVRRGFGSRLIERGLARELGGEARFTFRPEGLTCQIRAPLSAKLSLANG
jgi:PAS domain S-box-containing protein